jgi:hypothetical protein
MSDNDTEGMSGSLVVTTNQNDYYVIPQSALAQFEATPEQRAKIDEVASQKVPGSFASLEADEASARPSFAGSSKPTPLAWFQEL